MGKGWSQEAKDKISALERECQGHEVDKGFMRGDIQRFIQRWTTSSFFLKG